MLKSLNKKLLSYMFIFVLLLACKQVMAKDYQFSNTMNLDYQQGLIPGVVDLYQSPNDPSVRLIVSFIKDKIVLPELKSLSDSEIKNKLFANANAMDVTGFEDNRTVTDFSIERTENKYRITIYYKSFKKTDTQYMIDTFVVTQKEALSATVYYANNNQSENEKNFRSLLQSLEIIEAIDTNNSEDTAAQDSLKKIEINSDSKNLNVFNTPSVNHLFDKKLITNTNYLNHILINSAYAAKSDCGDVETKYVLKGKYTTSPGSALFNFEKLSDALVDSISAADADKSNCLSNQVKAAMENSGKYWAQIGSQNGCIDSNGNVPDAKPDSCPKSTFNEMKKSLAYIDHINKKTKTKLVELQNLKADVQCSAKEANEKNIQSTLDALKNTTQKMCCDMDRAGQPQGPLISALNYDADEFKNLSPADKIKSCQRKVEGDKDKKLLSVDGTFDCIGNVVKAFLNSLKKAVKAFASLFDFETLKALVNILNPMDSTMRDKVVETVKEFGKQIAAQIYSVSECLGPYEKEQYLCKMLGDTVGLFTSPALIGKFVKVMVAAAKYGVKASGVSDLVKIAAGAPPLKNIISASKKVGNKTIEIADKSTKPIRNTAAYQKIAALSKSIGKTLIKDISTPAKEYVAKQARVAMNATGDKIKSAGSAVSRAAENTASKIRNGLEARRSAKITDADIVNDLEVDLVRFNEGPKKLKNGLVRLDNKSEISISPNVNINVNFNAGGRTVVKTEAGVATKANKGQSIQKSTAAIDDISNKRAKIVKNKDPQQLETSINSLKSARENLTYELKAANNKSQKRRIQAAIDKSKKLEDTFQKELNKTRQTETKTASQQTKKAAPNSTNPNTSNNIGSEIVVPRSNGGTTKGVVGAKSSDGKVTAYFTDTDGKLKQKTFAPAEQPGPSSVVKNNSYNVGSEIDVPRSNGGTTKGVIGANSNDGKVTAYFTDTDGKLKQKTFQLPNHSFVENRSGGNKLKGNSNGNLKNKTESTAKSIKSDDNIQIGNVAINPIESITGQKIFDRAMFEGKNKSDFTKMVKDNDLYPKNTIQVENVKYHLSNMVDIGGGRTAVLAYVEKAGRITTQIYYRSNSQGVFRLLPGVLEKEGKVIWLGKHAEGEGVLNIPKELQKALGSEVIINGKNMRVIDDFLIKSAPSYQQDLLKYYSETGKDSSLTFSKIDLLKNDLGDRLKINPGDLRIINSAYNPAFDKGPSFTYKTRTDLAGDVKASVFKSKDGSLEYTFFEDNSGRAWLANVESVDSQINNKGLRSGVVNAENLMIPRFEYHEQIPINYRSPKGFGDHGQYGDAWPYLKQIPIIQNYYKAIGREVPP